MPGGQPTACLEKPNSAAAVAMDYLAVSGANGAHRVKSFCRRCTLIEHLEIAANWQFSLTRRLSGSRRAAEPENSGSRSARKQLNGRQFDASSETTSFSTIIYKFYDSTTYHSHIRSTTARLRTTVTTAPPRFDYVPQSKPHHHGSTTYQPSQQEQESSGLQFRKPTPA
ncbi:hypothetical protein J6590_015211 [Homalodisca vitripennis]|nr:hypothetical protein J6590_015211 [Homalodisca vitripennis]